ncbi:MAG TPA: GNAT family N-acetyltransferase [Symbiobacteriaceae bacterium]|nr:GNAT family N-acetyltransferase [Symbiobacteriaceae bacterium]
MYAFRSVHPSDLAWLTRASIASAWETLSPEERQAAVPETVTQLAHQQTYGALQDPHAAAVVATVWSQPVGYALATITQDASTDEPTGILLSLWVDPAHRRRGLGKTLLNLAENLYLQRGLRKMKLIAGLNSPAAVQMAQRAGYAPEGLIGIKPL